MQHAHAQRWPAAPVVCCLLCGVTHTNHSLAGLSGPLHPGLFRVRSSAQRSSFSLVSWQRKFTSKQNHFSRSWQFSRQNRRLCAGALLPRLLLPCCAAAPVSALSGFEHLLADRYRPSSHRFKRPHDLLHALTT